MFGYRLQASVTGHARKTGMDQVVYDYQYTTDECHRRVSPVADSEKRNRFALFFGGSFTFGDGVEDDETLPSQFGAVAPEFVPYNYGCMGHATQSLYLHVHRPGFRDEIAQGRGVVIYTYINPHLGRVIGQMRMAGSFGARLPEFRLTGDGIEHLGTFQEASPLWCWFSRTLRRSNTGKYFQLDWPRKYSDQHYELVTRLIVESSERLEGLFEEVNLVVLFYPGSSTANGLQEKLAKHGIRCLDYTRLFADVEELETLALADSHPSIPIGGGAVGAGRRGAMRRMSGYLRR